MESKKKRVGLRAEVPEDFKKIFQEVREKAGFETDDHAVRVILRDWVSKKRGPEQVIQERCLEAEKKVHIAVFGAVQYDEQGKVKNLYNIMVG